MNVTLHSQGYEVTLNSLGAELKSFRDANGKEFIWNSDPAFWMRSSPLLFPTIGNVRKDETIFDGKKYTLVKHGFCKESEFELTGQTENSITFVLRANDVTLRSYPYLFELSLTYILEGNQLKMTYSVTNRDTKTMPYHIGAHPGFMCPLEAGEQLSDYQIVFEKEEALLATPYNLDALCFHSKKTIDLKGDGTGTTLALTPELFDHDAVFFRHVTSRAVNLVHHTKGHGVSVAFPGFHSVAFWTPIGGQAPFLCIEPWNGAAIYEDEDDQFEHKRDVELLPADETKTYELTISLLGY